MKKEKKKNNVKKKRKIDKRKRNKEKRLKIEGKIEELDYLLCQEEVYSNPTRSKEVSQEKSNYEDKLSSLYEAWEELV